MYLRVEGGGRGERKDIGGRKEEEREYEKNPVHIGSKRRKRRKMHLRVEEGERGEKTDRGVCGRGRGREIV